MLTNRPLTVYHKILDDTTKLEKWERYNFSEVWFFGGKGASIDRGYDNANDVNIRISHLKYNIDISKFAIGDIVVGEDLNFDIDTQQDLNEYEFYNITSIKNNNFGSNPHLHLGGK